MNVPITAALSRAARGLLGWSQDDLAFKISLSRKTIAIFEAEISPASERTMSMLTDIFRAAGVRFYVVDGAVGLTKRELGATEPLGMATMEGSA